VDFVAGARELEGEQPPEQAGAGDGHLHRGRPVGRKGEGGCIQLSLRRYEPVQVHGFGWIHLSDTAPAVRTPEQVQSIAARLSSR
jgi:hypothetical protein